MSVKQRRFARLVRRATVKIKCDEMTWTEVGFAESQTFHAVKIIPYEEHPYLSPAEALQAGAWLIEWAKANGAEGVPAL